MTRFRLPDQELARLFDRVALNPVRWAIGLFLTGYLVGGFVFSLIEKDASFFDGLWWAFITMFTVGYGDLSPKTWEVRCLAYLVVIAGWSALLIVGAALAGRIAENRMQAYTDTPELTDDFDALIDQINRVKAITNHPRVVEALREVHDERKATA